MGAHCLGSVGEGQTALADLSPSRWPVRTTDDGKACERSVAKLWTCRAVLSLPSREK